MTVGLGLVCCIIIIVWTAMLGQVLFEKQQQSEELKILFSRQVEMKPVDHCCPTCGRMISIEDHYCGKCGQKLETDKI